MMIVMRERSSRQWEVFIKCSVQVFTANQKKQPSIEITTDTKSS